MPPQVCQQNSPVDTAPPRGVLALGLQARLTVLIIGLTFSVAWLACTYLVGSSTRMILEQQSEHAIHATSLLARAAVPGLERGDGEQLAVVLGDLIEGSSVIHVGVYNAAWERLASVRAAGYDAGVHPTRGSDATGVDDDPVGDDRSLVGQPRYRPAGNGHPALLEVVYPVTRLEGSKVSTFKPSTFEPSTSKPTRSRLLGYVRTRITVQASLDWTARTLDILAGVGIMIGLLAIPLCFVFARRIVTPLNHVCQTMQAFANGDLNARCAVRRSDEIGSVAASFNRMAGQHEQARDQLLRLNADLERRVARRTHELKELAAQDPLTGLFNRRHFDDVLSRRFAEARRYGGDLSYIMVDVDDFKKINDEFGHQVGDEVLMVLTQTIKEQLRGADVAARYGGDEFVILLPQTDSERARVLCERIAAQFAVQWRERFPQTAVTASFGIADVDDEDLSDSAELVRAADRALYQAKAAGKRRIVVASSPVPAAP